METAARRSLGHCKTKKLGFTTLSDLVLQQDEPLVSQMVLGRLLINIWVFHLCHTLHI